MKFTAYIEMRVQGRLIELPVTCFYDYDDMVIVDCVELQGQAITDIMTNEQDRHIEQQCIENLELLGSQEEAALEDYGDSMAQMARDIQRETLDERSRQRGIRL